MLALEQKLELVNLFIKLKSRHLGGDFYSNNRLTPIYGFLHDESELLKGTILEEVWDLANLVYENKEEAGKVVNIEIIEKLLIKHNLENKDPNNVSI